MSFKKIAGSSTERYRLLVSDGMYSNCYAMLATQNNHLINDKSIDEKCIVRVNKHSCNDMQGKKVIILLELDIINSGANVGQKIGEPIQINQDGTVSENDKKAVKQAYKSIGDDTSGQPAAKKPFQQVPKVCCKK